jgi:Cdc6-like AAA superfamily ATPase
MNSPKSSKIISSSSVYASVDRNSNFKVTVRVRPPLARELASDYAFQNTCYVRENNIIASEDLSSSVDYNGQLLPASGTFNTYSFVFDHVYDQNSTQKEVYENTARAVVDSALQGFNATIIAYGQTGTGKTFTMEGINREGSAKFRGIIPRAIEQIFTHIQSHACQSTKFLIRASYLQIYNETISDLLKPARSNLNIREDKRRGVYVEGLSEWVVRSPEEIYGLMEKGASVRATGETRMNEASSRSHAVFIVIAEQAETKYVKDEHGNEMTTDEVQRFITQRGKSREQALDELNDHVRQSFKVCMICLL